MAETLEFADKSVGPSERRQHSRQPVRSIAYVELDEGNGGIVLNVSEGGMSVQAVVSLMDEQLPRMRIQLSQPKDWVQTGARIAWTGKSRKVAGLQFVDLPEQARGQIREWVSREGLPARLPRESHAKSVDEKQLRVTRAAAPKAVPFAELAAPSPAVEDYAEKAPAKAETAVVLPATQAEEPTPALILEAVSEPTAARTPAPAPVSILSAAPRLASPPAGPVTGRVFDQPRYAELKLTGRPPEQALRRTKPVARHGILATLMAVLASVSLAAGWAAGRGDFGGVLAKVHAMTARGSAADREVKSSSAGAIAQVPEIQTTEAINPPAAVPSDASAPVPAPSVRRKAPAAPAITAPQPRRALATLQARALPPTIRRQGAEYASSLDKAAPPLVTDLSGGQETFLSAAGSADSRSSIPLPQVARQAGGLRRAELIHRVDPVYPAMAREGRIEGTVKLHVTIGADGLIRNIEVLSGPQMLVEAATRAVRQWRYSPTLLNGSPIPADNEISLVFRLPQS